VEKQRPYGSRSSREAVRDSIPALTIFAGALVALIIGVIDPPSLFSLGGTILFGSALLGFVVRIFIPRDDVSGSDRSAENFDLVIFDCDGVLVDSEPICIEVEARVLSELGWPMQPGDVARRWVGRSSADQLADITAQLGTEAATRFDELTTRETRKEFERSLTPVDGVRALLDHLDAIELPYCAASSSSHERLRLTLGIAGLMGRFAGTLFSSADVSQGKPAPDLFLYAAQKMSSDPARCAVVEDSVYGVQAAVAAGMTVFGYAGGLTDARELANAGATVFHDMLDLRGLLAHSTTS
jgi:HAD superfamily hydrolase (TIGR01509 family)